MKKLLLSVALLYSTAVYSQVATGLFQDNYTGSTGMLINPAEPMVDPNKWEVNIISGALFLGNNYAYYNQQTVFSLINYIQSDYHNGENISFFRQNSVHLNAVGFVEGPSVFFKKNDFSFGLFTDMRVGASIESSSAPQNLNNLFTIPFNQLIRIPELHSAYMNWAELGINAATLLKNNGQGRLYVGADVKLLGGLTAGKVDNNQQFAFERQNDSTVNATPVNMTYSYAQSATGGNPLSNLLSFNGGGVGTDIGALYIIGPQTSCNQLYDWKIGASINDIGVINYSRRTSNYQLTSNGDASFSDTAFVHATTINSLNETLSQVVYGDTVTSHHGTGFSIWLPMSVSLLVDKSLGSGFYIAGSVERRLAVTFNMIYSPNIEAITPRYESKWLTIAIPLSLYNETDFHFGASIRLGPLTIGSDDLESLLIRSKMSGTDVYVGLRISPFKSNCKRPKETKNSDKYKECPPQPLQ